MNWKSFSSSNVADMCLRPCLYRRLNLVAPRIRIHSKAQNILQGYFLSEPEFWKICSFWMWSKMSHNTAGNVHRTATNQQLGDMNSTRELPTFKADFVKSKFVYI